MRVAGGMLLGIGLSAVYLVPAMSTQQYVRFDNNGAHSALNLLAPGRTIIVCHMDNMGSCQLGVNRVSQKF